MKQLLTILFILSAFLTHAQDTTITTRSYPCDSSVTTTIPEQHYFVGYDSTLISDSSYAAYYDFQIYAFVNGAVWLVTPNYDTIPAHDTTFNCTGCGTCYITDTVITPPADSMIYGMFPNYSSSPVTLADRIHYAKTYSSNGYRYNFNAYNSENWRVQQVRDSGMFVVMTYNSHTVNAATGPNFYPTPAELPGQLYTFDSTLAAHPTALPDIICINNEPPTRNYWKGPVQDYINWLNGCITIGEKYHIPVCDGGIIMDVVYYVRWVYWQENKTDSADLLTKLGNLPPGIGAEQQSRIDFYRILIPALAASRASYINLHWYEPMFHMSNNSDTASGCLPIVINFLRSRTGKPLITHEFGIGSNSQNVFNQTADGFKNSGVKIMVYYAGTDPGNDPNSINHPEFWKAWIEQ